MAEEFFSLKVIIHDLKLNSISLFMDQSYSEIKTPAFLIKILDFPIILIAGNHSILAEGTTKGVFGNGRSSLFKYSEEKLKGELLEHPLRAIFADLQDQKGKIRKLIGKFNVSLGSFTEEFAKIYNNNEENFKRHCFKIYDENRDVVGLVDLSISLVKRSITYLNRTITAKLEKKLNPEEEIVMSVPRNEEKNNKEKENPRFFETFGKNAGKMKITEENDGSKITLRKPLAPQPQHNSNKMNNNSELFKKKPLESQPNNNKEAFFKENQGKTLPKSINLVNPSLKYMIEGNYCPPPMVLVKRSTTPTPNTQYIPSNNPNKKPSEFISNFQISPQKDRFPSDPSEARQSLSQDHLPLFQKKPDSVLDQLIEELLVLRNIKAKSPHILTISPSRKAKPTPPFSHRENSQKPSIFERKSQKMSLKDLEKTPQKTHHSDEYPEDFESASLSPNHMASRSLNKPAEQSIIHTEKIHEYSEDFESYTISETKDKMEKFKPENRSLSDSHSLSNSQKKMVNCFVCGKQVETSKATEHAKSCKSGNLRYSQQKKNDKFVASSSFKSIEEEEELAQKENIKSRSNKDSQIKESSKSEEYIEDFHSSAEEYDQEEKF